MQAPVYNLAGEIVEQVELSDSVFAVPFNEAAVHQVMVAQLANARQGTASSKTRGEVSGSTRKLFRQKGTGNARAGSIKSPLRPGGGIIFGPKPRDYRQAIPKKMRRLALRSLLSEKMRANELMLLKELSFDQPRTKQVVELLAALGVKDSVLIATPEAAENIVKSARNVPGVKTTPASLLNVVDLLNHEKLLMTVDAARKVEALWGTKTEASNEPV